LLELAFVGIAGAILIAPRALESSAHELAGVLATAVVGELALAPEFPVAKFTAIHARRSGHGALPMKPAALERAFVAVPVGEGVASLALEDVVAEFADVALAIGQCQAAPAGHHAGDELALVDVARCQLQASLAGIEP